MLVAHRGIKGIMMTEIQDTDLKSNNIHENRCF